MFAAAEFSVPVTVDELPDGTTCPIVILPFACDTELSMPSPPLSWIELPSTTALPLTPAPPLNAIVFQAELAAPPIGELSPRETAFTPAPPLPSGEEPSDATPIRLPVIVSFVPPPMIIRPSADVRYVPVWSACPEMRLPVTVTLLTAPEYWVPISMPTEFGTAAVPAGFVPT